MGAPGRERTNRKTRETERYRQAAVATFENLDWVIAYLRQIRKSRIAAVLQRNRNEIGRRLRAR
jgi:hypothetical protein